MIWYHPVSSFTGAKWLKPEKFGGTGYGDLYNFEGYVPSIIIKDIMPFIRLIVSGSSETIDVKTNFINILLVFNKINELSKIKCDKRLAKCIQTNALLEEILRHYRDLLYQYCYTARIDNEMILMHYTDLDQSLKRYFSLKETQVTSFDG